MMQSKLHTGLRGRNSNNYSFRKLLMMLSCLVATYAFDDNMGLGSERLASVPQHVVYYQSFRGLNPSLNGLSNLTESYTQDLGIAGTMNLLWVTYRDTQSSTSMFHTSQPTENRIRFQITAAPSQVAWNMNT